MQKVYTQGIFIPSRPIKLLLDPLLGYQQKERLYFLNRQRNSYFLVDTKRCVCSNKSCNRSFADLNQAGLYWVSCRKFSDAVMTIFSGQSVTSRVYTSRIGNGTDRLEPRPRWYQAPGTIKYQVPGIVPSEKKTKVNRTEPYRAVEKRH